MTESLDQVRFVEVADVHKAGERAARLVRVPGEGVLFSYEADYVERADARAIAHTLPLDTAPFISPGGTVPAFFAGLLPEGRRLTVLRDAVKTSLDDELTLLLAVGADVPGDVQIVPHGELPQDPPARVADDLAAIDFLELADQVDLHGIPGVQEKLSAEMISTPIASSSGRYILKLDPVDFPHLVANEHLHLIGARSLKLPVSRAQTIHDSIGRPGLLVQRFDRVRAGDEGWRRLALEDATQVLGLPPADKYRVDASDAVLALSALCSAPVVAARNLYIQFMFAWLTGNGDLHAKNVSALTAEDGRTSVAPIYDIPCTLLYGDDSLALPVAGRTRNLKRAHWAQFAREIGLPERAAASASAVALRAAVAIDLGLLPFRGSPLNEARRQLKFRRAEITG